MFSKWTIAIVFLIVCCLSLGQAITLSWLASFPENVAREQRLQMESLFYYLVALVSFVLCVMFVFQAIKKSNKK